MNKLITLFAILLSVLTYSACANDSTAERGSLSKQSQAAQFAEQVIADIKRTESQSSTYYSDLAKAISQEPRNEAWAKDMEAKLKQSYTATTNVPPYGLQKISCYSSKCALEIKLDTKQKFLEQQQAINEWIASSQPCGYDLVAESSNVVRIFLNCAS